MNRSFKDKIYRKHENQTTVNKTRTYFQTELR